MSEQQPTVTSLGTFPVKAVLDFYFCLHSKGNRSSPPSLRSAEPAARSPPEAQPMHKQELPFLVLLPPLHSRFRRRPCNTGSTWIPRASESTSLEGRQPSFVDHPVQNPKACQRLLLPSGVLPFQILHELSAKTTQRTSASEEKRGGSPPNSLAARHSRNTLSTGRGDQPATKPVG